MYSLTPLEVRETYPIGEKVPLTALEKNSGTPYHMGLDTSYSMVGVPYHMGWGTPYSMVEVFSHMGWGTPYSMVKVPFPMGWGIPNPNGARKGVPALLLTLPLSKKSMTQT